MTLPCDIPFTYTTTNTTPLKAFRNFVSPALPYPGSHALFRVGGGAECEALDANDRRWTAMPYVKGLCVRHVQNVDVYE